MITTLFSLPFATEGFGMPRNASTVAKQVDDLYNFITILSGIFFVLVIGAAIVFAIKYRQRPGVQKTSPLSHNTALELVWSAIPAALLVVIFAWGFKVWLNINVMPSDTMEVRVNAARWSWSFSYPRHGVNGAPELIVPADQNIKLTMISSDVLHSFFVPEFRVKRDVLPGRYSTLWFNTPAKALTLLQKVPTTELQLAHVVHKMGFAKDRKDAESLIKEGHIWINGQVDHSPTSQVKLHDVIEVHVDPNLRKSLLELQKSFAKKQKAATSDEARDLVRKEEEDTTNKQTPLWLRTVLAAMKVEEERINRFRQNNVSDEELANRRPEWLYVDLDGLRSMWGFVSDSFNLLCTEYCGKEHSKMITRTRVVSPKLFGIWLQRTLSKGATGPELLNRYGCTSCHSYQSDDVKVGPSFKGIYGRKRVVRDKTGKLVTLTLEKEDFKNYVRESILFPESKIVVGFENQKMPTFQGRIKQEEIDILIDYLEGLR